MHKSTRVHNSFAQLHREPDAPGYRPDLVRRLLVADCTIDRSSTHAARSPRQENYSLQGRVLYRTIEYHKSSLSSVSDQQHTSMASYDVRQRNTRHIPSPAAGTRPRR